MPGYLIGLDLGTSSCKAGLFDENGLLVRLSRQPYPTYPAGPGGWEQQPEDWWNAACSALQEITADVCKADVAGLGLSSHIGNQVLLSKQGRPLCPAVIWKDTRCQDAVRDVYDTFGRETLAELTGIDLPPGTNWPAPRLLWLRRTRESLFRDVSFIVQAKEYLYYRLTGVMAGDVSSYRGLVHQETGILAESLSSFLDLDPRWLPPMHDPWNAPGVLKEGVATSVGLPPNLPVTVGWNDLNAAILGTGAVEPNTAFDVTGTSEHLGVATARVGSSDRAGNALINAPYLDGLRLVYGVTSSGGGTIDWFGRCLCPGAGEPGNLLAGVDVTESHGLLFLPYLEGERAPVWDPQARGVLVGLTTRHKPQHILVALMEGVALNLRSILEEVESVVKSANPAETVDAIRVVAGSAEHDLWNRIKANIWQRPLIRTRVTEASCLGAAILAGLGVKKLKSFREAAEAMVRIESEIHPEIDRREEYDFLYECFQRVYPSTKEIQHSLYKLSLSNGRNSLGDAVEA